MSISTVSDVDAAPRAAARACPPSSGRRAAAARRGPVVVARRSRRPPARGASSRISSRFIGWVSGGAVTSGRRQHRRRSSRTRSTRTAAWSDRPPRAGIVARRRGSRRRQAVGEDVVDAVAAVRHEARRVDRAEGVDVAAQHRRRCARPALQGLARAGEVAPGRGLTVPLRRGCWPTQVPSRRRTAWTTRRSGSSRSGARRCSAIGPRRRTRMTLAPPPHGPARGPALGDQRGAAAGARCASVSAVRALAPVTRARARAPPGRHLLQQRDVPVPSRPARVANAPEQRPRGRSGTARPWKRFHVRTRIAMLPACRATSSPARSSPAPSCAPCWSGRSS